MSDLRLNLDTIAFKELVELGRSTIPTVAPGWTDHNIHDPGIMLMELAAWVADAQVYALARTSRGEREAFGHLLGLELIGPRPARGLLWPLGADAPVGTPSPFAPGTTVGTAARATGDRPQAPAFFTTRRIELTTAALTRVATRFSDGSVRDWTRANSQQGATFLPFGEVPKPGDTLQLTLSGTLIAKPAKSSRVEDEDAVLSIGFEIPRDAGDTYRAEGCSRTRLRVSLTDAAGPWPISVAEDSTAGLSRSGVLLLKIDPALAGENGVFTLSIQSERGEFLLAPRIQRVALNVLPVEQAETVADERPFFGTDTPGQRVLLEHTGLMYPADATSFSVSLSNGSTTLQAWTRTNDLDGADPDAAVYELDQDDGEVRFGNGLNGRMPAAGATLRIEYRVTDGAKGNLPRGIQWTVAGVPAPFVNSEVTSGGENARDLGTLRALARAAVRHARPVVTTGDLEEAARSFDDLDVRRAHELVPVASPRRFAGSRVLLAVGRHDGRPEADRFEETAFWLSEIRRRIVPRLPLGQSLDVIGPRLVDIRVIAHLVAAQQVDPLALQDAVAAMLRANFAITAEDDGPIWPFGRDVTALTVKGWLRNVEGVSRVVGLSFVAPPSTDPVDRVVLGPIALPRLGIEPGDITIDRPPIGGRA